MNCGVPAISPVRVIAASSTARARPKSVNLTRSTPSRDGPCSNSTFAGFTSRWINPRRWAAARPSAICEPIRSVSVTLAAPSASSLSRSERPATYSITRNDADPPAPASPASPPGSTA